MSTVTNLLPKKLRPYAKALGPAIFAGSALGVNALFGEPVAITEWKAVVGTAVYTTLTFFIPNAAQDD